MKASQLVEGLNSNPTEDTSSAKYSFRVVEEFPLMVRVPALDRHAIPIKGIRKLHYISYQSGGLKSRAVSCLICLQQGVICPQCSQSTYTVKPERVAAALANRDNSSDDSQSEDGELSDYGEEVVEEDNSYDSLTDSEQSDSEDEEDEIAEGVTVWAPFGDKQYPALVVSLSGVPPYLHRQLKSKSADIVCVRWIGERDEGGNPVERYSSISKSKLQVLSEDSIDHVLSVNCPLQYMEALNQAQCP